MCDKGARGKVRLAFISFPGARHVGGHWSRVSFFRGRRKCVKYTQLCDVGRRTTNAIPLWDLVEMQKGMLVDSDCDDPQAHCAAQGDAVRDIGRLRLECLLGDAPRCEGGKVAL